MLIREFGLCNCSTIYIEATLPGTRLLARPPIRHMNICPFSSIIVLLLCQQWLATIQGCCSHSYWPFVQWSGSFLEVSSQPNFTRLHVTLTNWETLLPELETCSSLMTAAWCLSPGWLSWAMPIVHTPARLHRACSRLVTPTFSSWTQPSQPRDSVGTRTWSIYFLGSHAMPVRRD